MFLLIREQSSFKQTLKNSSKFIPFFQCKIFLSFFNICCCRDIFPKIFKKYQKQNTYKKVYEEYDEEQTLANQFHNFFIDYRFRMCGNSRLEKPMNLTGLEKYLDLNFPSENMFYAVKIDGNFSYLRARSVPKQEK